MTTQSIVHHARQITITLTAAVIGGILFQLLHIPVPWLLGPMIIMIFAKNAMKWDFIWPRYLRNSGMIIIGYTIGLSMTITALHEMALQLPTMLLMTLLLMLLCSGIAYIVSRLSNTDYQSALLGSIPGGLTQVIAMAEEMKGVNLAVVTVTQVIRLMMIITVMPLIVMTPFFGQQLAEHTTTGIVPISESVSLFPNILLFAVVGIVFAIVGDKIHFPTAYLLGPIIGTIILQLAGVSGPHLPIYIVDFAQLMIGTHVGLLLQTNQISRKGRTLALAIGSGLILVIGSLVLSVLLTLLQDVSNATAALSLAPGGMDQMGIIAHEIHADLSIVSGYQLFRTLFIYFAVTPLLKLLFKSMRRHREQKRKTAV